MFHFLRELQKIFGNPEGRLIKGLFGFERGFYCIFGKPLPLRGFSEALEIGLIPRSSS